LRNEGGDTIFANCGQTDRQTDRQTDAHAMAIAHRLKPDELNIGRIGCNVHCLEDMPYWNPCDLNLTQLGQMRSNVTSPFEGLAWLSIHV